MTCGAGLCLTAVTPRPRRMGGCTARRTGASVRCMATTTADLAAHLSVDEGDVDVLLELLDEPPGVLADDLAEFLREVFDPHGERTAPAGLYWPDADPRPRRAFGLGGPDPTAL